MPIIPALRRLIYENLAFKPSLGYIARFHWKKEREWGRKGKKEEGREKEEERKKYSHVKYKKN